MLGSNSSSWKVVEQGLQTSSSDSAARLPFLGLPAESVYTLDLLLLQQSPLGGQCSSRATKHASQVGLHLCPWTRVFHDLVTADSLGALMWNLLHSFSGRTQTWERPTAWEVISHQRNKRDGVCWSNTAGVTCQGQGGWQEQGFQKKQLLWLYVNVLIKLQSLWPHTQAKRLSVFIRHVPWAHRCTARHRAVCSSILRSRSNGFTSIQEGPSLAGGQVRETERRVQELSARKDKGPWSYAGAHLSSTCRSSTLGPLSPDTCLTNGPRAPCWGNRADERAFCVRFPGRNEIWNA